MAKSARASSRKANNQRLKKNVFGPVESARTERLAAKLIELAAQPKPAREEKSDDAGAMEDVSEEAAQVPTSEDQQKEEESMDVDSGAKLLAAKKSSGKKRIDKRSSKKSAIAFVKYKDRRAKRRR